MPKRHLQRRDGRTAGAMGRRCGQKGADGERDCELGMAETWIGPFREIFRGSPVSV
jgi:hypothetical protein